ncbi:AAA family ATPase [Succinimonas sp.]|jgi:predicted kinase|uniref:AAA family ATPase n=1 Tax=Succinimonas sp. TaxID=1936151 RepID=UPI002E8A13E9|nr:ATP-binding protein [Succinimonas sp.]
MKSLILVTSPPACGKTYVSKAIAKKLDHVVYLDKDTLIVLSKQIFVVANQEYNRSSDFFEEHIRDYEYYAVLDLAFEALEYEDNVLINAPFTREVRNPQYIADLRAKLAKIGARLVLVWVDTSPETCHERMIKRNSSRDTWKLEHWDEYISRCNFTMPENVGDVFVFKNNNGQEFDESLDRIADFLN